MPGVPKFTLKPAPKPYKITIDFTINGEYTSDEIDCWVNDGDRIHLNVPIEADFKLAGPLTEATNEKP